MCSQNFTVAFDVNLGADDNGADGAAIVFHNDPRGANAIGAVGGGLAVGGIQNGLAIEFDTYDSTPELKPACPAPTSPADHTSFLGHRRRLRHHARGPRPISRTAPGIPSLSPGMRQRRL